MRLRAGAGASAPFFSFYRIVTVPSVPASLVHGTNTHPAVWRLPVSTGTSGVSLVVGIESLTAPSAGKYIRL
jgi:hypothetical protein